MFPQIRWRFAALYLILIAAIMSGLAIYLSQAGCLGNAGCVWRAVLVAGVLLLILTAVFALPLTSRTSHSIQQLTQIIRRITTGDWQARTLPQTRDDLGGLTLAFNDMVDTLRAQHTVLLEENGQLNTVLNTMADGVLITDSQGDVRLINPATAKLFALREKSALGHSFAEVVRHHQLIDLWQRCQEEKQEVTAAVELGKNLFLRAIVTPFDKGGAKGHLIILQDLTTMRHLQTVRRDFISNISHELRTPLASLRVIFETLQEGALDDRDTAVRFLERAAAETDVLTQMVEELLELSRIESGQVPLRLQATAVADLLLTPLDRLQPQAERAKLSLVLDLPPGLPQVQADPERVQQVVTNLLHNALKFTPEGGKITLRAYKEDSDGTAVVIAVHDTGIGIAKEEVGRIFERFYKSDRARTRGKTGTGLGLAISRHIVELHNGRIWVSSKEHKGSTFYFTLPTSQPGE